MAESIVIENFPSFNILEKSELTANVSAGATALAVANEDGFDTDHPVLVGNLGAENAEIRTPSSIDDDEVNVDALDNVHISGEKIYSLRGNKARIYRAEALSDGSRPAVGSFTLLDTIALEADQLQTEYVDNNGGSGYWYLYTFYNDVASPAQETAKDVDTAVRGGGYNNYVSVSEVRREAGFDNADYVKDATIADARDAAEDIANGYLVKKFSLPIDKPSHIVKRAVRLVAAGLLLTEDYGPGSSGTNTEGKQKYEAGIKLLEQIASGEIPLVGVDTNRLESNRRVRGYPRGSSGETPRAFTRDQVF